MRAPECHPDRKHKARGMCSPCYWAWYRKTPEYRAKEARYLNSPKGRASRRRRNARYYGTSKWFRAVLESQIRCDERELGALVGRLRRM